MENYSSITSEQNTDLKEQLKPYLQKWWLFLLCVLLLLSIALVYLRYTTEIYKADSSILIKDTRAGGVSELGALGDLGVLGNSFNTVENEIEVLTSRRMMANVVEQLNLRVSYFREGNFKTSEAYGNLPFQLIVANDLRSPKNFKSFSFKAKISSDTIINLVDEENNYSNSVKFGESFYYKGTEVAFVPTLSKIDNKENDTVVTQSRSYPEDVYKVQVASVEDVARKYASLLNVEAAVARGSVINLSIQDPVPAKAADILNQLAIEYNKDATEDKNIVARNTVNFIDERLASVALSLDSVEYRKESFKDSNNLTDIQAETALNLTNNAEYLTREIEARTQLQIATDLNNFIENLDNQELLPANEILSSASINNTIDQYNTLVLQYIRASEVATDLNPVVQDLQAEIQKLRTAIKSSLSNYIRSLETRLNRLNAQGNRISNRISEVPTTERIARGIEREQTIVESIYLFLLQKKEETAISLAVTAPKAKIVDRAWVSNSPVSPKTQIVLGGAVILGLVIPFAFIYLSNLLNDKIENRKDVTKKLPDTSFIGEIPKLSSDESDRINKNDRSVLAESFRILRTNLQFKLSALNMSSDGKTPIIIVTSTVKGEGKTLVSFNLSMTMANSGMNVLLIGGDIRNPQLHRYLSKGSKSLKGVTEYLSSQQYHASELVYASDANENLNIMLSGAIPPNPAELWLSPRVDELMQYGRDNYDVVIIDSAPSMLVTDTLLISERADVTVYVARANYTEKSLLEYTSDTIKANKLHNVAMVLNNVKQANFGYGNKYAYSYGVDKDSAWVKFLKAVKLK
ncbi:GumC family protein [Nonlabens ponticola]|uniref:non-specific protein-tyrosine kinase n=1 Tax=Nonlabens ponticola TaxID=2496866 RepID=A0A3S9MZK2_9FLAO|nr:tyrosine-protein kinase [Nonlabens ponticola]AZQ44681.1 polysaccharide biosynthesis tyrosine autokinase [Nonlabens ponticola]